MNNFMGIISYHYQVCEELITRQFLVYISYSSVFLSHLAHCSSDTLPTGILVYVDYSQNKACLAWIQSTIAAVVSSSKVIFSFDQCLSNTKRWFMQAWRKVPRQVPSLWVDLRFVDLGNSKTPTPTYGLGRPILSSTFIKHTWTWTLYFFQSLAHLRLLSIFFWSEIFSMYCPV